MSAPAVQTAPRPLIARPVPIGWRSGAVLLIASVAGLAMFTWPLLMAPAATPSSHSPTAPLAFVLILPIVVAIVLTELVDGAIDTKALAMLGVLSAIGAALRPLGAGTAGIETIFFLLVLAGRVFGPGFGFALGATTMFASALITAGVGPWLPFQMMAAAWVGAGAGALPGRSRSSGRRGELALLAAYGAVAAYAYGALLNLSFWPYAIGPQTELSFVAGAPVLQNLHRFALFTVGTSAAGWDTGRALTTAIAVVVTGPAILSALRRVARRARFEPAPREAAAQWSSASQAA